MSEGEKAFWAWWNRHELDDERAQRQMNFRMAFDAGYHACQSQDDNE